MDRDERFGALSRRVFIHRGAQLMMAPWVLKLAACAGDSHSTSSSAETAQENRARSMARAGAGADDSASEQARQSNETPDPAAEGTLPEGAVMLGLYSGDGAQAMAQALSHLDFSWLNEGDSVLIKVASNSGNPHPATTSPTGVRAMVEALKSRGAGRVIVADQAGVEWVRRSAKGRFSSTRERFEANGLAALADVAELHFFDEGEWESGYFQAQLPNDHHWPRGLYLANIVREVEHILYMPRISAHMLAGVTTAQKSAIGWLRDDSRHDLHNDARNFYEKYAEISYAEEIKSRFRMVVTLNEQVQLFGGPDQGTAFTMDPPLVLASSSLANHDALATSVLVTLQNSAGAQPSGMTYSGFLAPTLNSLFAGGAGVGTGEAGAWLSESSSSRYSAHDFAAQVGGDRAVTRGWALSGGPPESVRVVRAGQPVDPTLRSGIEGHGKGIYQFG